MKNKFEYIIVGSGPSGAMAAQTLTEAGKEVAVLDVGNKDEKYSELFEDKDFRDLRKEDKSQIRYLLGDDFEALPPDDVKTGAQLTPSRKSMIKDVDKWLKTESVNFLPMESLGYGGLGAGWGLGSYVYSDKELQKCGLKPDEMKKAYQKISNRIGISAADDDIKNYVVGGLEDLQAPLKMDKSILKILRAYKKKQKAINSRNIFMGAPSMAFLSEDFNKRKATKYHDTDFYADYGKSAYRAQFTIDELKAKNNFNYIDRFLVLSFSEKGDFVKINCKNIDNGNEYIFEARKLILAAGAIGTGRIALRSLKTNSLPILCNPYTYMPMLHFRMLGKTLGKKTSMAQAMMIYDTNMQHNNIVSVALYTYRSLLLHKLIKEGPVNFKDGRGIFQSLQSAFVIAGIHHPDKYSEFKKMYLNADSNSPTGDVLKVDFKRAESELKAIKKHEREIKKVFIKLGVLPISKMNPGEGASIHYAGTLPFSKQEVAGNTDANGRLYGTENVYSADGSSFTYLPAKGITLSLMANAHRVAEKILS